jgi:hypothetical protein
VSTPLSSARGALVANARRHLVGAAHYGATARRVLPRGGRDLRARLGHREQRLVFVVGSPRSGTSFLGAALGAQPGFVDLDEVTPLKAILPLLPQLPEREAARRFRRVIERVRLLSAVPGLRGVEQTPETSFSLGVALLAYPDGKAIHIIRDGRDVVCSLLERRWLSDSRGGADDANLAYGAHARFWVEPERGDEFASASEATRAAWAWRRYVTAARRFPERTLEIRYEDMAGDPDGTAATIGAYLGSDPELLATGLRKAHRQSIGRFREELTAEQLADVEREAGALLAELGYR